MASKSRESYLRKRGNVYWFYLAVPRALRDALGKFHIEESLRTASRDEANRLKHRKLDYWFGEFRRLSGGANGAPALAPHLHHAESARRTIVHARTDEDAEQAWAAASAHVDHLEARYGAPQAEEFAAIAFRGARPTLREAFDKFIAGDSITPATQAKYSQVFDEFMGRMKRPPVDPEAVTRNDADRYVTWLDDEAVSAHGKPFEYRTKDERVRLLRQLWRHLQRIGLVSPGPNIWEGHKLKGKRKPDRDGREGERRPFTDAEMLRILSGPEVGSGEFGKRRATYTKARLLDFYALGFWIGCRIEELCERTLGNIRPIEGGYLFDIPRSKTDAGIRTLPVLHPIPVAILKRAINNRKDPHALLFPFCLPGGVNNEDLSHYAVKALSRYNRDKLRLPKGVTFHSTRGTFYTRCMELNINHDWYSMYLGHELGGMAKHYAGKKPGILEGVAKAFHYAEPIEAAWRGALGLQ